MALLRDGTVMAWGLNTPSGSLGNGTNEEKAYPAPAPVHDLNEVTAIAAGLGGVSTALLRSGKVMDWGYGQFGELGDGVEASSDLPVEVSKLIEATAIATGQYFSLAAAGTQAVPPPVVTKLSPRHGPTAGGTTVTISGSNFTGATAVDFGSISAAHFTVNSATSITAISPASTARIVNVTVTTPGGTSALSPHDHYRFRHRHP
jgi:alpha-tubulin suppressor-like RCC1 family protein